MVFETIAVILGIASLATIVAIAIWKHILIWADNTFFPWLEKHLPTLAPKVRNAFAWFDKKVAVPVRNAILQAWKKLRYFLLKATVRFEKRSSSRWVKRWTAYLIKQFETREVIRQEVTEELDWSELPDDIREAALRRGISSREINVTELRDEELIEMMNY